MVSHEQLQNTALFHGITEAELQTLLGCLSAFTKRYEKGATILHCGQIVEHIGIVLSGSVLIERDDLLGNHSVIGRVSAGDIFAETYACIPDEALLVNVTAAEHTEVLFIRTKNLLATCPQACGFHQTLIRNLLCISARKNLQLSRRMLYTSPKTIRSRLITYFSDQAAQQNSRTFNIPFNRQQLADYLNLDRSAMCSELSKMQKDGLLEYHKNTIRVNIAT